MRSDPAVEPAARPQRHEFLDGLMGIRYFAAISVVLVHQGYAVMTTAVTFFFVLSGFVLAYNHIVQSGDEAGSNPFSGPAPCGMNVDVRTFWIARVARIYPAYLLALLLLVAMRWNELTPDNVRALMANFMMVQS
jgi:peptidoglycan/LPS O-acetylase OafA/YrhL